MERQTQPYVEQQTVAVTDHVDDRPRHAEPVQVVTAPAVQPTPVEQRVRTDAVAGFAPDALLSAGVGLVLLLAGLVAITRAGLDTPLSEPVVSVAGFRHTALLGFIEAGFGVMLLLSGALRSRAGAVFFGGLLGIASFVAAVQPSSFDTTLAVESSMAWLGVVAGALVALAGLALPRMSRRMTVVDRY